MDRWIGRHELVAYYVLACALSLALGLLLNISILFGLLALFGPATAAVIVARIARGRGGAAELRVSATRWRVRPGWYLAALGLPVVGFALGHAAYVLTGHPALVVPGEIAPISLLLFVLVIGEEIGWRGFMLAGLLRRHSPLVATLVIAAAWALWHSPLYILPGMPNEGRSFLPFVAWVVPLSFLLTWLWLGTRSAWLTTVMHGAANIGAAFVFPLADADLLFAFGALGTAIVAVVVASSWSRFTAVPDRSVTARTSVPPARPAEA
jgi:membrane protease YdiL (CAAX protease family)